jgi:hypothetical protein
MGCYRMHERHVGISVHDLNIHRLLMSLHKVNFHCVDERGPLQTRSASNIVYLFRFTKSGMHVLTME